MIASPSANYHVQETVQAQQLAAMAATSLHLPPAEVLALMDKSLPTAVGLAGKAIPLSFHLCPPPPPHTHTYLCALANTVEISQAPEIPHWWYLVFEDGCDGQLC